MNVSCLSVAVLVAFSSASAAESEFLSLVPVLGMTRADICVVRIAPNPTGILVLAPECNGNGEKLAAASDWQSFAAANNLDIVGISFASAIDDLHNGKGYYYPENGSGQILLDGIKKAFGDDLPILIYGFSGGAHFTSRFVEWKPDRVIAWCAYSAAWWDMPKQSEVTPPGIVACGMVDERLGASLTYFKQGRAIGRPWLWIGVAGNGHSPNKDVESFIREYFSAVLEARKRATPAMAGTWVDIDKLQVTDAKTAQQFPAVTGWLPAEQLLPHWRDLQGTSQ